MPTPEGFDHEAFLSLQQKLRPMFERLAIDERAPRTIVVVPGLSLSTSVG